MRLQENGRREDVEVLGTQYHADYRQEISEQEQKESSYTASDGITKETEER